MLEQAETGWSKDERMKKKMQQYREFATTEREVLKIGDKDETIEVRLCVNVKCFLPPFYLVSCQKYQEKKKNKSWILQKLLFANNLSKAKFNVLKYLYHVKQ